MLRAAGAGSSCGSIRKFFIIVDKIGLLVTVARQFSNFSNAGN